MITGEELTLIYVLCIHFIADFIFQSERVAKGKSTSKAILFEHVLTYGIVFFMLNLPLAMVYPLGVLGAVIWVNIGLHLGVDWVTSKIVRSYFMKDDTHMAFVFIGLDQLIHTLFIVLTFAYLN